MFRIVLCILYFAKALAECDPKTGPSGPTECILLERYNNQYQWGTCLTDQYINTKSNQMHHCIDRSATYCYYQCMLEIHDKEDGPVSQDCSCKAREQYTSMNLTLAAECYSPSGTDCSWYENCLEKRHPCKETGKGYAMEYATKFCNLYSENYEKFSVNGQQWIDATRKCLQVTLVPILRPYRNLTCSNVKDLAFKSHVPCYLQPDDNNPTNSICNLGYLDFYRVFWTIHSSLTMSFDSSIEAMKGFWNTMKECSKSIFDRQSYDQDIRLLKLNLKRQLKDTETKNQRWLLSRTNTLDSDVTSKFVDRIADKLSWTQKGVMWFSEEVDSSEIISDEIYVNIFLANRKTFDLRAYNMSTVDMDLITEDFKTHVKNNDLVETIGNMSLTVISVLGCLDVNCNNIAFDVTMSLNDNDKHNDSKTYIIVIGSCCAAFFVLLVVGFAVLCSRRRVGFPKIV